MSSPVPAKSQPLHNFELPELKWNKDGQSSGKNKRRRSMKSPSRRPNASSASPARHSPLLECVSAMPPRLQSPLRESAEVSSLDSPLNGDCLMKQSQVGGESSRCSPNREGKKDLPVSGESERLSLLREEALRHFHGRDFSSGSEALRKGKSGLIEYRRNHSRNSAFANLKNGVNSSNSKQAEEKLEKKSEAAENDAAGVKKSKILIRFPCRNDKPEEEDSKEALLKTEKINEHGENDEVKEEGKISNNLDEDTKIWKLRPRMPKRKSQNATVGGEKGNVSRLPEKNKAQSQLKNENKSGGKEGKSGGSGGMKKQKGEKNEKIEKVKNEQEKDEKKEKIEKERGEKKEKIEKEKGEKKEKIENEKGEKQEKIENEKDEKDEKDEKQEKIENEKGEKKEKRKLSISIPLTKEEIEEDFFALTGSKPARRPKKRAKNVQKQVDYAFPGLWLVSITPQSYKVSENSMKG